MKGALFVLSLAVMTVGLAGAYQDPLYLYDPIFALESGFVLSGGADYYFANRTWDTEGKAASLGDLNRSESYALVPLRFGYALTNLLRVDVVLPFVEPSSTFHSMGSQVTNSSFGLSNPWLVGSYLFSIDESNVLRPRLGVKFPVFATTEEDFIAPGDVPTGDKNINLDLTLGYAFLSAKSDFTAQIWVAGRYGFPADYEIEGTTYRKQPPTNVAGEIAPGYFWDKNGTWQTYAVANLMMDLGEAKINESGIPGTQRRRLAVGVRQAWVPAPEGELIFDFTYGVSGNNTSTGFETGLGYFGYIKM